MKYKIRQAGKTRKAIEFHISKEIISGELNRIYEEISRGASLPGFRSGRAPLDLIKKRYKKEAEEEAVKNLVGDSLKRAVDESDMEILGMPEIADLQFDAEKGMSYKAVVNIRPEVRLKNYKGLSLKKASKEVKEADVAAQIDKLREANAKFVTKEGQAAQGDYIICDVDCTVEKNPVEKKENVWLYVGEDSFIPGKSLEGLKPGDKKDIEKDLPGEYSKKEIAGKRAEFRITVKEVKMKVLPELNDEFLAVMGDFKSLDEFRETIRRSLERANEAEERRDLEGQALKLLDKAAVFDVPEFMVDRHHRMLVDSTKERLKRQQYTEEQIASMEKDITERLKAEAVREVRAYFIINEIAGLEKLDAGDKELEEAFGVIAASSGKSADEVKEYYEKNDMTADLREEIKQRKVLDFLIKNAIID